MYDVKRSILYLYGLFSHTMEYEGPFDVKFMHLYSKVAKQSKDTIEKIQERKKNLVEPTKENKEESQ